jgi:inhibitor of KinA sporulation pathway (predicted exonuclease)
MEVVIVDVESTCWRRDPPPGEQSEIIEIGVCLLNTETLEISNKRSLLVKPSRSKVSPFCTELTTLTQKQVDLGMTFEKACGILELTFKTKSRLWASWGNYDQRMFTVQCQSFGVPYPFSEQHVNLKQRFAELAGLPKQVGMAGALKQAHLPLEGTHHRGDDDAYNIARLGAWLLQRHDAENVFKAQPS